MTAQKKRKTVTFCCFFAFSLALNHVIPPISLVYVCVRVYSKILKILSLFQDLNTNVDQTGSDQLSRFHQFICCKMIWAVLMWDSITCHWTANEYCRGISQNAEWLWLKWLGSGNWVNLYNRFHLGFICTGKTDLKHDSLSFLTLIT